MSMVFLGVPKGHVCGTVSHRREEPNPLNIIVRQSKERSASSIKKIGLRLLLLWPHFFLDFYTWNH